MKVKLAVVGAAGRVGRRIIALAAESGRFEISAAIENEGHPEIGKDAGLLAGIDRLGVPLAGAWTTGADVAVDFSLPEAAERTLRQCAAGQTALVMGTTGMLLLKGRPLRSVHRWSAVAFVTLRLTNFVTSFWVA